MAKDEFMSQGNLALLRAGSPSWKLLASDDAPFCCAFLYHEFLEKNVRNLPEARLVLDMRAFLEEKHSLMKQFQKNLDIISSSIYNFKVKKKML